jgi:hypothetical protein
MLPALLLLLPLGARAAQRVEPVSPVVLSAPLTPAPALAQLRLDLAALRAPGAAAALPAALPPAAFARLSAIAQAPAAGIAVPAAAAPALAAAPAGAPAPGSAAAAAPTDALARVRLAQQVLGKFSPEKFATLAPGEQQAALDDLWDHWTAKGLVRAESGAEPALRRFDALIERGVDDKTLTAANKSILLGVGVLGYPLEDSVWLARTRIRDALDENALRYPQGQRWHTQDGTPEFLGTTKEGQDLVDAWGRAVEYGRAVLARAAAGETRLPKSAEFSRQAAAGLASVAAELKRRGDEPALVYLRDEDPTFMAFLLDARKPGYYLYNGDASAVARIMATDAARALGIRRIDHKEGGVQASTYFYRPERVAARLEAVASGPASRDAAALRDALKPYAEEARALARSLPAAPKAASDWSFVAPETLAAASASRNDPNLLSSYKDFVRGFSRYDLPITAGTVRALRAEGRRYGALNEGQWKALLSLYDACPALRKADPQALLRVVSQPYETDGRLFAPAKGPERGVQLQLFALDRLAALEAGNGRERAAFLRFAASALEAALAKP